MIKLLKLKDKKEPLEQQLRNGILSSNEQQ